MGFFGIGDTEEKGKRSTGPSVEFLHKQQCKVCPLDKIRGNLHPHIKPTGSPSPDVYILGEAPGEEEDKLAKHFVGKTGKRLRRLIDDEWKGRLRWNNVVRTRPPKNRDPDKTEIECCRPSLITDIEQSKPKAIFGFGNVPLYWALQRERGITLWSGRRIPLQVGRHKCWFFPIVHPSYIERQQDENEQRELDFAFQLDVSNAFNQVDDLPEPVIHTQADAQRNVEIITGNSSDDTSKVLSFIESLYDQKNAGLDYETKQLRPYANDSRILTVALSSAERTVTFPFDHPQSGFSPSQTKRIKQAYEDFLYKAECRKLVHNLAFEMEWSAYFFGEGCLRAQPWEDSQSQSYIIDERPLTHSLDFMVLQYFGLHLKQISNLDKNYLDKEPLESVLNYNGMDAKYHRLLYLAQRERIKELDLQELYRHQLRRVPTMVLTQLKGVPVNHGTVKKFYKQYSDQLVDIERKISEIPAVKKFRQKHSYEFRPSAPKDIIKLLSDNGIVLLKADEEHLKLQNLGICDLVLEWRGINKMLSTYVKPLMRKTDNSCIHPDGMLHPVVKTTSTRTWRTSSNDPNSQNFAKHEHREVRSQVAPISSDEKIVAFDFAGIQARNVAMESKDKALVDAFWDDYDVHAFWAKRCVELFPRWVEEGLKAFRTDKDVFKKYRQISKNQFVFPSFFGAYPKSISGGMNVPEHIAERLQDEFWGEFPDIHGWQQRIIKNYHETGYVTGLSGFRRHAPISTNQIINSSIQADESIIVCSAMAALSEMEDDRFQANMEIHDDLSFIWPAKDIDKNAEVVAKEMTRLTFPWMAIVPLVVEMSIGNDWASLKEVAKFSSIEIWGHKRGDA